MAANRSNGSIIGKSNKTSAGGNTVRQFNASGSYQVPDTVNEIDVLVVGGGGGGGDTSSGGGGGGGAGGMRHDGINGYITQNVTEAQRAALIGVVVGAGGGVNNNTNGSNGDGSHFGEAPLGFGGNNPVGNITASHGGYGGTTGGKGANGASGGGSGYNATTTDQADGNTPPTDPVQGYPGGRYNTGNGGTGGGGAGGAGGQNPGVTTGGAGGVGYQSSITGTNRYYAGGGGGSSNDTGGAGGLGGGGGAGNPGDGGAGEVNSGGGGGGDYSGGTAAAGGSGVVIVREKNKAAGMWNMNAQNSAQTKGQWPRKTEAAGISQSLRFNDNDSPYLSRTPSSAGNRKTFTFSTWVKRSTISVQQTLMSVNNGSDNSTLLHIYLDSDDEIKISFQAFTLTTTPLLRDTSAWYHIMFVADTTQASTANRFKIYLNGTQLTLGSSGTFIAQNTDLAFNDATEHNIGRREGDADRYFDGYLSGVHFVDGQALPPTNFGQSDPDCPSIWRPIRYHGQHGLNGFHLEFKQNGVGTGSASTVGADTSGNGNHWTSSGIAATDQVLDIPTNNFCTWNPLGNSESKATLTEGNLKAAYSGTGSDYLGTTMVPTSGKWYVEFRIDDPTGSGSDRTSLGLAHLAELDDDGYADGNSDDKLLIVTGALNRVYNWGTEQDSTYTARSDDDIIQFAWDLDTGKQWIGLNNTWFASGNPAAGSNPIATQADKTLMIVSRLSAGATATQSHIINCGQDSSFAGNKTAQGNADSNGIGDFYYTPPSGFLALCTENLASTTTIDDPEEHFNTVLYTGNNKAKIIQGVGFQPDFVWNKTRSASQNHFLYDSIRGGSKDLRSNQDSDEGTSDAVTSFETDGFGVGSGNDGNENTETYVNWCWKIPDSYSVSESGSGSSGYAAITGKRNITAGMSIMTWTGNGGSHYRFSHGLSGHSITKEFIAMVKRRDADSTDWSVLPPRDPTDFLILNTAAATSDNSTYWNDFQANNTYFQIPSGNANLNASSATYVAYCFHSVPGFSKVSRYKGNGSANGTFVYTGFRPAYVMIKWSSGSTEHWQVFDTKRDDDNVASIRLKPSDAASEATNVHDSSENIDFVSNGFKCRGYSNGINQSGGMYIYMAFAESPFVTSGGTPNNAR